MERLVGTVSRGMRAPIIREGDDLEQIVTDVILEGEKAGEYSIRISLRLQSLSSQEFRGIMQQ